MTRIDLFDVVYARVNDKSFYGVMRPVYDASRKINGQDRINIQKGLSNMVRGIEFEIEDAIKNTRNNERTHATGVV